MDVGPDRTAQSASDEVVLRWTLERRDYLDAMRPSVALRAWRSVRALVVLIVFWVAVLFALGAAELAVANGHLPSLPSLPTLLAIPAHMFSGPQGAPLEVFTAFVAVFVVLVPWWAPERALRRNWRKSPRLHGQWEAVLEPTSITVRHADSETTRRWTAFDAVSEVRRSYRLRLRDTKPPVLTVIPKRAMPGATGPAALGELLRSRVEGAGSPSAQLPS